MNNNNQDFITPPTLTCDNVSYQQKIISSIQKQSSDSLLIKFVKNFYSYIPIDYIKSYDTNFFIKVALNAYEFFRCRPIDKGSKDYKVEISNYQELDTSFIELKVINVDKAFIVDSIKYLLDKAGLEPFFFIHPVIRTNRTDKGELVDAVPALQNYESTAYSVESLILCRIYGSFKEKFLHNLKKQLLLILDQVDQTSKSWHYILQEIENIIALFTNSKDQEELSALSFLQWLKSDNFTFLSCIDSDLSSKKSTLIAGHKEFFPELDIKNIMQLACNGYNNKKVILIGKINKLSTVHKNSFINYILVRQKSKNNNLVKIFLGLYSSSARQQSVKEIPILKDKLRNIVCFSKFHKKSYNAKKFESIFESFPREVLFEITEEDLYCSCLNVLSAMNSGSLKLCFFPNSFSKIVDIVVFLPCARLTPDVHVNITSYLIDKFNTKVLNKELNTIPPNFCSLYISMHISSDLPDDLDIKEIENDLENLSAQWVEALKSILIKSYGLFEGLRIFKDKASIFPKNYTQNFTPSDAIEDLKYVMQVYRTQKRAFNFIIHSPNTYSLKIYTLESKLSLSQILPLIENLSFNVLDEQTFKLSTGNNNLSFVELTSNLEEKGKDNVNTDAKENIYCSLEYQNDFSAWIYNFNLSPQIELSAVNLEHLKRNVETTLEKISADKFEYNVLYKLVVLISADYYQIRLLQALVYYLQQINFVYSKDYVKLVLIKHYQFTKTLLKLFDNKFNPQILGKRDVKNVEEELQRMLTTVSSNAEDKVLRTILRLIIAILRTNYYQKLQNGEYKSYLSFKIKSKLVPNLPLPVPYAEIFVYANEFEAIHLRGGKVARGGIRWSDREEDYRTEILGLMKAQMTKNTIIVPVGSKGGFFVKIDQDTMDSTSYQQLVIECYKNFLRGLLDITDNTINHNPVYPKNTVIYDEYDPYLVVAADKGTATFSDYANSISAEYNFWLADAFASGGSAGYDHKKMGITAKGAWISVQHHFRDLGINVQKDSITIIGIGDMSGDVFGNGLLRSDSVKLVGAFNHTHIFIDPNPDPKKSFQERFKLFKMPKSKWSDYNSEVLSKGGAIFERSAKIIELSKEAQQLLNISESKLTPEELIKALLKAKVDLVWNGGIGTYIKASDESTFDIGDKSNDMLRCDAKDILAKVIAEGGNLGVSQRGRIEYAKKGGRINTDFIDNSAGVECSDHEVNIKIALNSAVTSGKLTIQARNKILDEMTPQIEKLVLVDNDKQNQAITITEKSALFTIEMFANLIKTLEYEGLLNRNIEFLPSDSELTKRSLSKEKMTRPELAILLSYSKMNLYSNLIKTNVVDESFFNKYLLSYFPELMQKQFSEEVLTHPLRKEIILTVLTNKIINQLSGTIFNMTQSETRASLENMVKAYVITNEIFSIDKLWQATEELRATVDGNVQIEIFSEINKLIRRGISWFAKNLSELNITTAIDLYEKPTLELTKIINKIVSGDTQIKIKNRFNFYLENNIPKNWADKFSAIDSMISILDIVLVSNNSKVDYIRVAKAYFEVGEISGLDWLRKRCDHLISDYYWNRLAIQSLKDDLYDKQRRLLSCIFASKHYSTFNSWWQEHKILAEIYTDFISDIVKQETVDMNMIVVANKKFEIFLHKI